MPENITYFVDESDNVVAQQPGISEVPLQPGFKITVADGKAPAEYEVVKWSYSLGRASTTRGLVVIVRPVKQYWFTRIGKDKQVLLAYFLIAITLVPTAFGLLLYFFNRSEFLALLGWYCRYVVGWALFATGALLPLRIKGWISSQPTLLGTYLGLLLPILGIIAGLAWVNVSRPPQLLINWPSDYELYARYLFQKFETTLPIAASVLPWVALLAKLVGLESVGKVFELFAKVKKP